MTETTGLDDPTATEVALPPALMAATASESALRRFLHGLPGVDEVGARHARHPRDPLHQEGREALGDRRRDPHDRPHHARGRRTPPARCGRCARRRGIGPTRATPRSHRSPPSASTPTSSRRPSRRSTAAGVAVASVATAFPSGRSSIEVKLLDTRQAVEAGATEIDMVIDRGAFLAGRYGHVLDEIRQVKDACGDAHLKVILETGELATLDNVRRASWLAMAGGADFIKTSTGKVSPASTTAVTLVMLQAVRDFAELTGRRIGVKSAGGIRTTKEAIRYLVLVHEVAGAEWLTPDRYRFGASSLLNDLLLQRHKQATGRYWGPDYLTLD
jgi:deoxyribose-phosphate aldolase